MKRLTSIAAGLLLLVFVASTSSVQKAPDKPSAGPYVSALRDLRPGAGRKVPMICSNHGCAGPDLCGPSVGFFCSSDEDGNCLTQPCH